MPRKIDKIPNAWEPYMDGNLWEFSTDEMSKMSNYTPMANREGVFCGKRMYQWYIDKTYYVRFVEWDDTRTPEQLANWEV